MSETADVRTRTYNAIDSDGHVLEPPDMCIEYFDPAYRDRAPRLVVDHDGWERLALEGRMIGPAKGVGSAGAIGARTGETSSEIKYVEGRKGGFDPHARLVDMDLDGIDAAFLYPSLALNSGAVEDPGLAAAWCRAYNRWLVDYCSPCPDRLFPVAMLPMQSVELAIQEARFARETLGISAAFVRPNPYNGRMLGSPDFDPLWAVVQDLDVAVGVHEGTGGMPAAGVDRFPGLDLNARGARHMISHTVEMMLSSLSVIWYGTCERFPKLRFGFLESGGGWMVPWLDRMDRHFDDHVYNEDTTLTMPPSEYFRRQCWISFEPPEASVLFAAEYLGADKLLWATDYPHPDGFFPGAPAQVAQHLPEHLRHDVLAGGAMRFYGLALAG